MSGFYLLIFFFLLCKGTIFIYFFFFFSFDSLFYLFIHLLSISRYSWYEQGFKIGEYDPQSRALIKKGGLSGTRLSIAHLRSRADPYRPVITALSARL